MQRIIQDITQQLIDRLPENDQYYRLDDLRSWGFPSFIVRRIKIELERNLAESMIIPKTDWANTNSEAVLAAWQKFVEAIRAEARLPASYAQTVIETAVADVVEMLAQPRKNIPVVVFGTDDELDVDEIFERVKAVVVYPHFASLISRYVQKKKLEKLSKERCKKIVTDADEKLTDGYSPLNWAQMLEPLFKLMDGSIDTNLLRLFFEDKNMPRIARKLDLMNDSLSRAELIEVLSSPDLLDFEGYEDDQSSLFGDQPVASPEGEEPEIHQQDEQTEETDDGSVVEFSDSKPESTDDTLSETDIETKADTKTDTDSGNSENPLDAELPDKERIAAILFPEENPKQEASKDVDITFSKRDVSDAEGEGPTLNATFLGPSQEEEPVEDDTLNAVFRKDGDKSYKDKEEINSDSSDEKANRDSSKGSDEKQQPEAKTSSSSTNGRKSTSKSKEKTPIWMRYMSKEEIEEYEKEQQQQKTDEDGFIEEPIIDLTKENSSDEEVKKLSKLLKSDRELFVEEIFRGSDRAYDEAVENIAAYSSWSDVSKYIEKDIFKRNLVDMYSEAAVDFTDRLQTYFLKKTKSD